MFFADADVFEPRRTRGGRGLSKAQGFKPHTASHTAFVLHGAQIEKDEEYIKAVTSLGGVVEQLIKANNAINIYEEYFPDAPAAPGSDAPGDAACRAQGAVPFSNKTADLRLQGP